jgi:hypothetical protein
MACSLNCQNYFSVEKCDVEWDDFLEFLELFLSMANLRQTSCSYTDG